MADVDITGPVSVIPSLTPTVFRIGAPSGVLSVVPALTADAVSGNILHISVFDIVRDYSLSGDVDVIPAMSAGLAVSVSEDTICSVIPIVNGQALAYRTLHESVFDVVKNYSVSAHVHVTVGKLSSGVVRSGWVNKGISSIPALSAGVVVSVPISGSIMADAGINGGIIRNKSVKFGSLKFVYAKRNGPDKITPLADDKLFKTGISLPKAYTRTFSILVESKDSDEYAAWMDLLNQSRTLFIDDVPYDNTYFSSISDKKIKPGLDRWVWEMEFVQHVYSGEDTATIGDISIPNIISVSDFKKTPIIDERFVKAGVDEPLSYSETFSVEFVDELGMIASLLESKIGKTTTTVINGITRNKTKIADISSSQLRGGGNITIYTVSFQRYQFNSTDSATFAGIVLDNPEIRDEKRTPLSDERLIKAGISEPKSYSYDVSIDCLTTNPALYTNLEPKLNQVGNLVINGRTYSNARITDVSGLQPRGGGDIWKYTVSFMCYVFSSTDSVSFGNITFQNIIEVSDDNRTPILTESYNQRGISEPSAYSVKNNITIVDLTGTLYDTLSDSKTGAAAILTINGKAYQKSKITNLTKSTPRGGGNTQIITVEFSSYWYSTTDTAQFGAIALSNPVLPNAMDITPEYSVEMSTAYNIENPIPIIVRRFAFECITENPAEFEALVSSIGPKLTLTINGKSYELCYISMLSALQPRGGGNIWSYTIEFSQKKGERLVNASFDGITLPNAVMSDVEREILQTRKTMHNGTISASLGSHAAKRVSFTCQANSTTAFDAIENLIGEKKTLIVEGKTYTKAYISELSDNVKIGDGTARLYTYTIGFEEETA